MRSADSRLLAVKPLHTVVWTFFAGSIVAIPIVGLMRTQDRRDNFDIFLPEWLACHTKVIFGALYLAVGLVIHLWLG